MIESEKDCAMVRASDSLYREQSTEIRDSSLAMPSEASNLIRNNANGRCSDGILTP